MMWHIICGYIEGGQLPLSEEADLDEFLFENHERQKKLSFEKFLFGLLLGDFTQIVQ